MLIAVKKARFLNILFIISLLLTGCLKDKKNEESVDGTVKKKRVYEANLDKKLESQSGSLFGDIIGSKNTTFQFSTSNVLWRATLNAFEDIPLSNVDYAGGVIISDWYSPKKSKESVKIVVRFTSNELNSSSVQVTSFKKNCDANSSCETLKLNNQFNSKVKDKIIKVARELKISDETKKK